MSASENVQTAPPVVTSAPAPAPRSLTQMFRDLDDGALAATLLDRPDLSEPPPTGFSELASRATTRHSVSLALQRLTAFELWFAGSVAAKRTVETEQVVATYAVYLRDDVRAAFERLRRLGLLWGDSPRLHPVRALASVLATELAAATWPDVPPAPHPPDVGTTRQAPRLVTKVAAGSAYELLVRMEVLLEHCDHLPLRLRRDGAPTSRDVRTLAGLLDVPAAAAIAHLDLARSAGLLGLAADERDELWIPTALFDTWQDRELADRWCNLADAWFDGLPKAGPRWVKELALSAFGDPDEGRVVTAPELKTWLDWQRPRRSGRNDRQAADLLDQMAMVGLSGLGALASYAQLTDVGQLSDLLPGRVDQVVVQADLTAIAPGPLTVQAGRDLALIADVESRGGATVFRFSAESLRRARAAGWTSAQVLETLQNRSRTPLPQPLRYLIADLDRELPKPSASLDPHRRGSPTQRRAGGWTPPGDAEPRVDRDVADAIVQDLRAGSEPSAASDPESHPDTAIAATEPSGIARAPLAALREAAETGEVVWCGYVDRHGERSEAQLVVQSVDEGVVHAEDHRTRLSIALPLHRVLAAHILRSGR